VGKLKLAVAMSGKSIPDIVTCFKYCLKEVQNGHIVHIKVELDSEDLTQPKSPNGLQSVFKGVS
jgi:hypothetical protein